jgi:hypothetical protein
MVIKEVTPTLLQTIILSLFLLTAPFAMTFTVPIGICTGLPIQADPLYAIRASFITGGLIASALSVLILLWDLRTRINELLELKIVSNVILRMSMTICSLSIGWVAFPYWINGVFQAYRGNRPPDCYLNAFDPKALLPMIWIGDIWRLGVIFIFLVAFFIGSALLLISPVIFIKGRNWREGVATVACLAITAAIFFLSPGYGTWLAD